MKRISRSSSLRNKFKKKSKSKYITNKVIIDGIEFDSTIEANYYLELKTEAVLNKISNIQVHIKFPLYEKEIIDNIKYPALRYTADFMYFDNTLKKNIIVEIKSIATFREKDYKLRRRMFMEKYIKPSNGNLIFKEIIVGEKPRKKKFKKSHKLL